MLSKEYKIRKEGAMKYITNSKGVVVSNHYHDFDNFNFSGTERLIGQSGSLKYILKIPLEQDGFFQELTKGYQQYIIKDGDLYGKSGTSLNKIYL